MQEVVTKLASEGGLVRLPSCHGRGFVVSQTMEASMAVSKH
jgi:hypothetical protein